MTKPAHSADHAAAIRAAALDWFVRCSGGQAFDVAGFQTWLQADPAHATAYARWEHASARVDDIPADVRAALQRELAYDKAMDAASPRGADRTAPVHAPTAGAAPSLASASAPASASASPRAGAGAAGTSGAGRRRALVLGASAVMTLSSGAWLWRHRQTQPLLVQAFETGRGEQAEVPLPDGTTLRLDSATRVEVSYYRQRRELKLLDGQLFLKVQKDADSPFQVLAGDVRVTVVGTQFSVRHTPRQAGADGVEVTVTEGKVKVEGATDAGGAPVLLTAGQQVGADRNGVLAAVTPVEPAQVGAWRNYQLRFIDRRLDQVLAEMSRYRDWPLAIDDPEVAALQLTGVFDPRDVATFQRVLPLSLPVRLADAGAGRKLVVMRR